MTCARWPSPSRPSRPPSLIGPTWSKPVRKKEYATRPAAQATTTTTTTIVVDTREEVFGIRTKGEGNERLGVLRKPTRSRSSALQELRRSVPPLHCPDAVQFSRLVQEVRATDGWMHGQAKTPEAGDAHGWPRGRSVRQNPGGGSFQLSRCSRTTFLILRTTGDRHAEVS